MKSFIVSCFLVFFLVSCNGSQTYYDALKKYFSSGDFSQVQQFIGRAVNSEDMNKIQEAFTGKLSNHLFSYLGFDVTELHLKSRVVFQSATWNDEKSVVKEIRDVKAVQAKPGYFIWTGKLFENINGEDLIIAGTCGWVEVKVGEFWPTEEERLIPAWILTLDEKGKLIVSKPKDKSKYLLNTRGGE